MHTKTFSRKMIEKIEAGEIVFHVPDSLRFMIMWRRFSNPLRPGVIQLRGVPAGSDPAVIPFLPLKRYETPYDTRWTREEVDSVFQSLWKLVLKDVQKARRRARALKSAATRRRNEIVSAR